MALRARVCLVASMLEGTVDADGFGAFEGCQILEFVVIRPCVGDGEGLFLEAAVVPGSLLGSLCVDGRKG